MSRSELERGRALEMMKRDIAGRLRRVCADFEETEFAKLVDRIAEIEVRYRLRDQWIFERVLTSPNFN